MPVIDVHTHMFTAKWLELLKKEGGIYNIKTRPDGQQEIFRGDTPVVIPQRGHFDYAMRIEHMDSAGIDISIVSLTCPNVFRGLHYLPSRRPHWWSSATAHAHAR